MWVVARRLLIVLVVHALLLVVIVGNGVRNLRCLAVLLVLKNWLADLKILLGSGVRITCRLNSRNGGIHDQWGLGLETTLSNMDFLVVDRVAI